MTLEPPGSHAAPRRYLISPAYDLGWFALPGVLTIVAALLVGALSPAGAERGTLALWIVGVLLVDVTHVYASLYRTYLDPGARARHRLALALTPALCLWFGFLLHYEAPLLFWGALAYVAVFHFIKQHVGFVMLYTRAGQERARDRRLNAIATWTGTLAPIVYWHCQLPREFAWFMQGDFLAGLPASLGVVALALELPVWIVFIARRVALWREGQANWMVPLLALLPAINWHLGIVVFNDDRIFTITNVFLHGVPYLALVWVTGGRARVARGLRRAPEAGALTVAALALAFYGLLVALALAEETLWDRLIWHDHEQLFGASAIELAEGGAIEALVVALLTVPQATHYVLDRWIWRVGPKNPALAGQLGFKRSASRPADGPDEPAV